MPIQKIASDRVTQAQVIDNTISMTGFKCFHGEAYGVEQEAKLSYIAIGK